MNTDDLVVLAQSITESFCLKFNVPRSLIEDMSQEAVLAALEHADEPEDEITRLITNALTRFMYRERQYHKNIKLVPHVNR
jgi:hypothetical protein